jgi:hypothetical protein
MTNNNPQTSHASSPNPSKEDGELTGQTEAFDQLQLNEINSIQNNVTGTQLQQGIQSNELEDDPEVVVERSVETPDISESTREAEEHSLQVHVQEEAQVKVDPLGTNSNYYSIRSHVYFDTLIMIVTTITI